MSAGSKLQRSAAVLLFLSLVCATTTLFPRTADAQDGSTTLSEVAERIGAMPLYTEGLTGAGIDVAVIDTGVEPVAGLDGYEKVLVGPDLSFEAGIPELYGHDTYGHGTVMASIIAGDDGPGGFQGVAPGSRILSVKVADNSGAVDVSQVIAALDWVVENGHNNGLNVRVINLAYVTDSEQSYEIDPLAHAVERAWRAGYVVVVPAGNGGDETTMLGNPAADPYVITVAAADDTGTAAFSSRGSATRMPDVLAPGHRILGLAAPNSRLVQNHPDAVIDDRFLRGSGTSQATAVVAGAAALLLEQRPELTPDQVKALLILGVVDEDGKGRGSSNTATSGITESFDLRDVEADYRERANELFAQAAELHTRNGNRSGREAHLLEAHADDLLHAADVAREEAESLGVPADVREREVAEALRQSGADLLATAATTRALASSAQGSATDALAEASELEHRAEQAFRDAAQAELRADAALTTLEAQIENVFAHWSGSQLGNIVYNPQSGAGLIDLERSAALPAFDAVQHHVQSDGSGSLEASRGSNHVTLPDGTVLEGERTWTGATWTGATWTGATWTGATWTGATWTGATWTGATWTGATWTGATWTGATWTGATWTGATWTGATWTGATWTGATWTGATWTGATWTGATWTGATWTGATWTGATWTGATWTGATWTGATWTGATWTGATWTGATWTGATWTGATWTGATWTGATWS